MRTFNHITLNNEIRTNPHLFIGQREFRLLESFKLHIDTLTEVNFDSKKNDEFSKMPDIREFVSNQLNIDIPSATKWTWAIGFDVENQTELLEKYFNWVDDYERKYPVDIDVYQFKPKLNLKYDITNSIKHMCVRAVMYGFNDLSNLRATIDGYYYFKNTYQIELTENEKVLKVFLDYWRSKVNKDLVFDTWDRALIKEEMGINPFSFNGGSNGGWVFERFIEVLEKQTDLKLEEPIKI